MARFVVLEHHWNGVHWDFMLETELALRVWALSTAPTSARSIVAKPSADHRLFYLDYEGEISGGRGHVKRWDQGTFEWLHQSDNEVRVKLRGQRLKGSVLLKSETKDVWSFMMLDD